MTLGITVKRRFQKDRRRGISKKRGTTDAATISPSRVPRISKLMALAIRLDQLIRDGVVADQAELAKLGHVSRARMTQILNLLSLTPDIQAIILEPAPLASALHQISERQLRPIAFVSNWETQRFMWRRLRES